MVRFTFAVEGEVQVDRTLLRYEEDLEDARPVWDKLADRFAVMERRQFASEGAYGSGGWPSLSPAYAAWKAARYPGKTILRRTDELYESLTSRPFGVEVIDARSMALGSGTAHGPYHQRGGGNLPQRRPVEFPESERRTWVRYVHNFIRTGRVGM